MSILKTGRVLLAAGAVAASFASMAPAANAGSNGTVTASSTGTVVVAPGAHLTLRSAPSSSGGWLGQFNNGQSLNLTCKVAGQTISGSQGTTNIWDKVGNGYVSAAYVRGGQSPAWCTTPPTGKNRAAAIAWAKTQLNTYYVGCNAGEYRFGKVAEATKIFRGGGCNTRDYVLPRGAVGYDCSGLIVAAYKRAGINMRYQSSRAMLNYPWVSKNAVQPGDLFVKSGHVVMYIGNGQVIESTPHTPSGYGTWKGTRISSAAGFINNSAYSGRHVPDGG